MSISEHSEVELKFSVPSDYNPQEIPQLHNAVPLISVDEPQSLSLSALYFDTADLRLTRNKITLRRRTGGTDAGWHLKMQAPHDSSSEQTTAATQRIEHHAPLGNAGTELRPPLELLEPIRKIIHDLPLVPIAHVNNARVIYLLRDSTDTILAEFADDHVSAWSLLPHSTTSAERPSLWREWEIELAPTIDHQRGKELLSSISTIMKESGAYLSSSPSKLVQALGSTYTISTLPLIDLPTSQHNN